MPNEKELQRVLDDHDKRITRLESLLPQRKTVEQPKGNQKLPDHIIQLRTKGFFAQPRTAGETHQKLKGTYHCEIDRVAMALLRLAERKELRKASKVVEKKKYQAYVW